MGLHGLFFPYFSLFYKQLNANDCSIKVAKDWIRTRVLWKRNQPHCQLCHNHFCLKLHLLQNLTFSEIRVLRMEGGIYNHRH